MSNVVALLITSGSLAGMVLALTSVARVLAGMGNLGQHWQTRQEESQSGDGSSCRTTI